ncbi:MAG: choice-of-anchor tandem repeat GloVer-containing protein [Candidatus Cybelea sp.]
MKLSDFSRYALSICVAAAMLAGCGGPQPLTGAPGAMPQSSASVSMHAPFGAAGNLRSLARRDADGGKYPQAPLIDVGGILYGTTNNGGAFRSPKTCHGGCGTIFSITTSGVVKVLHSFGNAQDGRYPEEAGLVDVGGTLYGTTSAGGAAGDGTVFSITTGGVENVLHSFGGQPDGSDPLAESLIEVGGELYGTTWSGGAYGSSDSSSRVCPHLNAPPGCGTVFSITTSGTERVLHGFGNGDDGQRPGAGLVHMHGTLYGTTFFGGNQSRCIGEEGIGCGTVFSITTSGAEKVLHRFGKGHDGRYPQARLLPVHGALYGTTSEGGSYSSNGTVFVITAQGVERILYRFATQGGSSDAAVPDAGLIDVKGTLYGTTYYGGGCQQGTAYSVTTAGVEKVLHAFCNGIDDGSTPWAGLVVVRGLLYGTTWLGGGHPIHCGHPGHPTGCGTVYSINNRRPV